MIISVLYHYFDDVFLWLYLNLRLLILTFLAEEVVKVLRRAARDSSAARGGEVIFGAIVPRAEQPATWPFSVGGRKMRTAIAVLLGGSSNSTAIPSSKSTEKNLRPSSVLPSFMVSPVDSEEMIQAKL